VNLKKAFYPLAISLLLFICGGVNAQILTPVKWSFTLEQDDPCSATLIFKAAIEPGWHVYSQFIGDGGPVKTTFTLDKSKAYSPIGKVSEGTPIEIFDKAFEMKLQYFSENAEFRQKIKINTPKSFKIKGNVEFMVCDDEKCLPPEMVDFAFDLNGCPAAKTNEDTTADQGSVIPVPIDSIKRADNIVPTAVDPGMITEREDPIVKLEEGCGEMVGETSVNSIWGIFIGGILGGLLALLTPCVFPMIPMTVSFFTKRSGSKKMGVVNAVIYAISIIVIYVGLGFLVTITLGSDALNAMASNSFFNLAFFIIFVVFAVSFFGAFEIVLPSWLVNKADQASDKGGLIGIFFMAFTLSLVSFSCTGPIIGTLLVEAAHGRSYLGPLAGMTGFSLALALPFALFAAFPSWLSSLPKSGGWLNSVKVSLGFLELALALKFLSNVDLAYHWGFLKREIFIVLWIVIFGMLGFYLLGKLKFSHDSEVKHISVPRLLFAILTLSFTLYLVPGIWGAPLKLISGFPPPEFYKEWLDPKASDCPHDLTCFKDYEEGMRYAKQQGKPVMVDFTGWSCVNCRKMEDNVWSDSKVLKTLSQDYVVISLYVDDKQQLKEGSEYISESGKKIVTTGNKWSDMQRTRFKTNSQPYYVLLDNSGKILANPRGYSPDIETYAKFLEEGKCRYQLRK
jgi:thiol:disulfide interchange protein